MSSASNANGPLRGVRILDLSWGIAGPVGVMLLSDLGADVVKVEPPDGDPFRHQPGYHVWNRGRRSVCLDLKDEAGRQTFLRLCDHADVLVESFSPGTMNKLGLGYEDVAQGRPRIIYASVPAYPPGHRFAGRPGWDALVQARTGMQHAQPGWRPGPVFLHFPAPSMGACFLLASGVLAALIQREHSGRGQNVQTSLHQGVFAYTTQIWQAHERASTGFLTMMQKSYPPGIHQSSVYECADGEWIHAATMSGRTPTRTLEDILGLEPVDMAELFRDESRRAAHDARLREAFRGRRRDGLLEELHAAGLGAEAVAPMADVFQHPQFQANGMVVTVDDPTLGATTQVGPPAFFSRTPGAVQGPQPRPGEHSREVLTEAGLTPDEVDKLIAAGVVRSVTDGAATRGAAGAATAAPGGAAPAAPAEEAR